MKIAIDISPLKSGHYLQHRVRGTGFYITNLRSSLEKYHPENNYIYFKWGDKLPEDIDLVHIPYFEPFFLTIPMRSKYKTVVTVHDLTPLVFKEKFPAGLKGKLKWNTQKQTLKRIDGVITDSYSSKEDIQKLVGVDTKNIKVVHLAAADHYRKLKGEGEKLKVRKKFKLPSEFLLYVGDATWNKNLVGLVKAVNKTDIPLVIVGSAFINKDYDKSNPWNRDLFEAQVLSAENKNIIPIGFVKDDELVNLYNSATAFIMPSYYEGFGLPVLEAMQSGCPVITTRAGSLNEVADSAAYFVEPDSVASIEEGIRKVMSDKDLRNALSIKGLEQARRFSWKKCADETNNAYKGVVLNE